jgi:hypothetical protein
MQDSEPPRRGKLGGVIAENEPKYRVNGVNVAYVTPGTRPKKDCATNDDNPDEERDAKEQPTVQRSQ